MKILKQLIKRDFQKKLPSPPPPPPPPPKKKEKKSVSLTPPHPTSHPTTKISKTAIL